MSQAIAIANHLLDRDDAARARGERPPVMSPMKAIKLAYYAHGWYYGIHGRRLVTDEQVEAWPWGPVFPSLYHAAKHFGNGAIQGPLHETDFGRVLEEVPRLNTEFADRDPEEVARWLDDIQAQWGVYDAIFLSNSTHLHGSPWDVIYNGVYGGHPPKRTDIPPELIKKYFRQWHEKQTPQALDVAEAGGQIA